MKSLQSLSFQPVSVDELSFALTLFVGVANHQLAARHTSADAADSIVECEEIFRELSHGVEPTGCESLLSCQASLADSFRGLWSFYQGNAYQVPLCARVLAFYFLMSQTRGAALASWVDSCAEDPTAVILHPAVLQALAEVNLTPAGQLDKRDFLGRIEVIACAAPNPHVVSSQVRN